MTFVLKISVEFICVHCVKGFAKIQCYIIVQTASNVLQAMLCLINELDETGLDIVADAVRNRRDACRGAAARGGGDSTRSSAAALVDTAAGAALKRSNGSMGLDETFD